MKWIAGILCLISCFAKLPAEEPPFTAFQLKNGITVYLKTLPLDESEVSIQLAFKNGFASFSGVSPAAYKIAPDMAVNSEASTLFDGQDDAIDMYYSVEPLYSYWILDTDTTHMKKAMTGLQKLITSPLWNESLLRHAQQNLLADTNSEENNLKVFYQLNAIPTELIIPTIKPSLSTLTLKDIAQAYRNLFLDPAHAVLIIAGDFKAEEVQKMVVDTFSAIPEQHERPIAHAVPNPQFPKTPQEASFEVKKKSNPLVTVTFPVPYALNADSFVDTELMALALEESLKQSSAQPLPNPSSIDISIELPLYPLLESPWLLVTYQSGSSRYQDEAELLVKMIQDRLQKGLDEVTLSKAVEQMQISDSFWKNEPEYWLAFLGNQSLMGFNPQETLVKRSQAALIPLDLINQNLKKFPLNRYTLFYSASEDF